MFGYNVGSVIQRFSIVGIIVKIEGSQFQIMFEDDNNSVRFVWYPLYAVSRFKVIG